MPKEEKVFMKKYLHRNIHVLVKCVHYTLWCINFFFFLRTHRALG